MLEHPEPIAPPRSIPVDIIGEDEPHTDYDLGPLKTGKEAEVFIVERTSDDGRRCLLAHKRYRPRTVSRKGELQALGFQKSNSFMNDMAYRDGRKFAKSRDARAVERMTGYGKKLLTEKWPGHEIDIVRRLWDAGADVPYPVAFRDDGMLMQYIGDDVSAAPRLAQARLTKVEVKKAWTQMLDNLRTFLEAGIVHGDLSTYNLLWWEGSLWCIDFPQAVDLAENPHAFDFLHRDITNVCGWFGRNGIECDAEEVFAEMLLHVA